MPKVLFHLNFKCTLRFYLFLRKKKMIPHNKHVFMLPIVFYFELPAVKKPLQQSTEITILGTLRRTNCTWMTPCNLPLDAFFCFCFFWSLRVTYYRKGAGTPILLGASLPPVISADHKQAVKSN